jgi:hypothetical protein
MSAEEIAATIRDAGFTPALRPGGTDAGKRETGAA